MTIFDLAKLSVRACEHAGIEYMLTGAFATGCYTIPRSTRDVNFVLNYQIPTELDDVIAGFGDAVKFGDQVQFDTIIWGKRHIGQTLTTPYLKVELFELFDAPFVKEQFSRRVHMTVVSLDVDTYVPTAEDVIVQKLRWARDKDLMDATDLLAVQSPENLDVEYIRRWCREHGSEDRLNTLLEEVADID
ncbi:MAG: hypothetical protein H7A51_18130 [Akkermansiaceae bacterium]|nr:hypothetical protein [Akkermansiaceae bacterium]